MRPRLLALAMLSVGLGAASPALAERSAEQTVRAFVRAYNMRDFAGMELLMHPQASWRSVAGGAITVEGEGREALLAWNRRYLTKSCPTCRSRLDGLSATARFVTTVERATWTRKSGEPAEQSGVAVYEVEAGTIRNVWYFPADKPAP